MGLLISTVLAILSALGLKRLLPAARKHRRQVRFIRELWQAAGNQIVAVLLLHFRRCPTGSTI
jgi:hypothetical protein